MHVSRQLRLPLRAVVAGGLVVAALVAAGCGSVGHLGGSGNAASGKTLFTQKCGSCHVLADAGTKGTIGPNLDAAFYQFRDEIEGESPSDSEVGDAQSTIRQVVRGQIAYPTTKPSTGAPGMPADIVEGQDAADIAEYVATVAGVGELADTPAG